MTIPDSIRRITKQTTSSVTCERKIISLLAKNNSVAHKQEIIEEPPDLIKDERKEKEKKNP